VVRDTQTGKIYVGLNTGVPKQVADTLHKAILEQYGRIWKGEVVVVRTAADAVGGHSEVNALNPAIRDREKVLGRKPVEKDLGVFELHNLWLSGDRAMTTAPRCEHCARITRGVSVTQSMFVAEGGKVGVIDVPQRGSATPAGSSTPKPVTTTAGELQRGSVTRADSSTSRPVTTASGPISGAKGGAPGVGLGGPMIGVMTAMFMLSMPLINEWFAKNYLNDKWTAEAHAMVVKAIEGAVLLFNLAIIARGADIVREKAAGRQVRLRVDVDTEWVGTRFGPAQIKASVSYYAVMLEGETAVEWPLFQRQPGFWSRLFGAARITNRRSTYYFTL
jgi:hypothetical protein